MQNMQSENRNIVSNHLRQHREATGRSRAEVAVALAVTEGTVARWETGRSGIPDAHKLALAEMFTCTVADLMGWDAPVESPDEPAKAAA